MHPLRRVVRPSKFRHVYGQQCKRPDCYDDIRITKNSWDSPFCDVNPLFVAIVLESAGGGAFIVLPISNTGRLPVDYPLVAGHRGAVLDIQFCPHNDFLIASASEDATVKIWEIPSVQVLFNIYEKLGRRVSLNDPVVDLVGHQKRACLVQWHPTASNVLMSAGSDQRLLIWDIERASVLFSIEDLHPDLIQSIGWNWNGSKVVTTCKDKMIRIIDPRKQQVEKEFKGHDGAKPARALFLKDGKVLTTGFSKMSCRQYALWDTGSSNPEPLIKNDMDTSNGVMFPYYDPDIELIYLFGKGDCVIRYFEYTPETCSIHYLNTFISSDPQRGGAFMPKRGLDVKHCEVARFYKLHNVGLCETVSFFVPRKSDVFQSDLYPETRGQVASITCDEWRHGQDRPPILRPVRTSEASPADSTYQSRTSFATTINRKTRESDDKSSIFSTVVSNNNNDKEQQPLAVNQVEKLTNELNELRRYVIKLERRVAALEVVTNHERID
ncbi:hypothetical protein ACOME3_000645 [Neoechinorhynchus agilis]